MKRLLTDDESSKLQCFLLMTTNFRKRDIECNDALALELNEDGTPKYKNAQSNADWMRECSTTIERILEEVL